MKYAVTITTRNLKSYDTFCTKYSVFDTIKDLNNYVFSNVCNTESNDEIIGFYFEVFN